MRRTVVWLAIIAMPFMGWAQEDAAQQNFTSSPNDLGALQNSVNLYTGQVSFPMTVASLSGRGGLAPKVTINYNSSGTRSNVETWNRERPTGILGLGWSFNYPKIICNPNNTGTRHDDTFYLVEGGQTVRLICLENTNSNPLPYRPYQTEIYQPWQIHYYHDEEKWVVIKDDGTIYTYGDKIRPHEDGTVQYTMAWGNWIGSSNTRVGQTALATTWNLSEIKNLWDDKITYTYENIEEFVGTIPDPAIPNPAKYTQASVLSKITGPTGNYIQLNYEMKVYEDCPSSGDFRCEEGIREYQDPHVESSVEPDAYQEKYEPRYLESIEAFNEKGLPVYDVSFGYNENSDPNEDPLWLGSGEMAKRLLTSIEQTNYTGSKLPKTTFQYFREGEFKGYMNVVSNSIGGNITYRYKSTSIKKGEICLHNRCWDIKDSDLAEKRFEAVSPGEDWTEPNIFMGPDYVVVIWRQDVITYFDVPVGPDIPIHTNDPRPSFLQIYQWQGEWVQHDMGSIGDLRLSHDLAKHELAITLQKDHFGVVVRQGTNNYHVSLFHKDKYDGSWRMDNSDVTLYDGHLSKAAYLGELFFSSGHNFVALGNIGTDLLYTFTLRNDQWEQNSFQQTTPTANAFTGSSIKLIAHNTLPRPNDFKLYLLREDGRWEAKEIGSQFTSDDTGYSEDRTYWYSTPTFSFVMADDNPEYVFTFDTEISQLTKTSLTTLPDHYAVNTPSTSNINISAYPPSDFHNFNDLFFYRFDGTGWNDFTARGAGVEGFDIYYGPKIYHSAPDVIGWGLGESRIFLMNYNANLGDWEGEEFITPVNWLDRYIKVSPRSALIGDQLYYLEPDGTWINIGDIETDGLNGDSWRDDLKSANDLYVVSKPYTSTEFYQVINGEVETRSLNKNMDKRTAYYDVGDRLLGSGKMAAFDIDQSKKADARSFYLYKWDANDFDGGHEAVVVNSVKVNDGELDIYKSYDYNYQTAKIDQSGDVPFFNLVKVVSGSDDPTSTPKGYTMHYFHNGRPLVDLPKLSSDQTDNDVLLYAGSNYLTEMYDSDDNLVSESETVYSTFKQDVDNTSGDLIYESYFVRPTHATTRDYLSSGVQSVSTVTEYNAYGYPSKVENYSNESIANSEAKSTTIYFYYPSFYDEEAYNIYSEIVGTTNYINGETVSASRTVWEIDQSKPQPSKTYQWRGFDNPQSFGGYDGSTPAEHWRLSDMIIQRDAKGNILESEDYLQDKESAIYDDLMLNPTLSASYASFDQIAGTSFEAGQEGKMSFSQASDTESYTGSMALENGSVTTPSLPNAEYELYYWYKNDAGTVTFPGGNIEDLGDQHIAQGWTLRKYKLIGSGIVTVSTTGFIDELRIHPENAYVTTYVYDGRQQKIAETGTNMLTTYYKYDDFNRQHYIADHDENIVLYYEYGFKKME